MLSLLPSTVVLGLAALAALHLTLNRSSPSQLQSERALAARALALTTAAQALHFLEEAATGFNEELGGLLGLPSMPFAFFMVFNLVWIGIWVASVGMVRSGRPFAFFAAWFLAIAGMFNGIAHPALALAAGAYFPGVVSSPVIAGLSVWLWLRLRDATWPGRQTSPAS